MRSFHSRFTPWKSFNNYISNVLPEVIDIFRAFELFTQFAIKEVNSLVKSLEFISFSFNVKVDQVFNCFQILSVLAKFKASLLNFNGLWNINRDNRPSNLGIFNFRVGEFRPRYMISKWLLHEYYSSSEDIAFDPKLLKNRKDFKIRFGWKFYSFRVLSSSLCFLIKFFSDNVNQKFLKLFCVFSILNNVLLESLTPCFFIKWVNFLNS